MHITHRTCHVTYILIGLVALIGTWGNNLQLLGGTGFLEGNLLFWQKTLANPASRSITVDLLCLSLAAILWMLLEARRLSMRGVWLWILMGVFVAIGAAFPWFLAHRQRVLARQTESASAGTLTTMDMLGVVLVGLSVLFYTGLALFA